MSVPFQFVPDISRHPVLQFVLHMGVERCGRPCAINMRNGRLCIPIWSLKPNRFANNSFRATGPRPSADARKTFSRPVFKPWVH
jgi:hypothetical protein